MKKTLDFGKDYIKCQKREYKFMMRIQNLVLRIPNHRMNRNLWIKLKINLSTILALRLSKFGVRSS